MLANANRQTYSNTRLKRTLRDVGTVAKLEKRSGKDGRRRLPKVAFRYHNNDEKTKFGFTATGCSDLTVQSSQR